MSAIPDPFLSHAVPAGDICRQAGSDADRGLAAEEARHRMEEVGPNRLPEDVKTAGWKVFLRQFASPLIYVLFGAAILALALGKQGDAVVILLVVLVNALIGGIQEGRAARSMESLRKLSAVRVRVLRAGEEERLEVADLVPGDVLLLSGGDAVGADARVLEAAALEAGEAALTGEALPVRKDADVLPEDTLLADRRNMIYAGTHITSGRGKAVVVATGPGTELGRIARMTSGAPESKTPLEQRMDQFGRHLVIVSFLLFALVIGVGMMRGMAMADILMVAISQMVSLVPEGLPVALTIALAVGMQRMAGRGAIVRRLAAVETLGSTSIICSDKTGTLTKNEMTVTTLCLPDGRRIEVSGTGCRPEGELSCGGRILAAAGDLSLRRLLEAGVLCNDSQLVPPGGGATRWSALGDPTEAALLTLALKAGMPPGELRQAWPRRAEIPFDPATKLMATQHGHTHRPNRVFLKGAPEALLPYCGYAQYGEDVREIPEPERAAILETASDMAGRALRLLAFAMLEDGDLDEDAGFAQFDGRVVFLGLMGQMDPPREEVKEAVRACRLAGIRPVMVTGDHKATGFAIARLLGIAGEGDRAVDGRELEAMPEQELVDSLDRIAVFARVHPAQKLRIVEAFQSRADVVAMTGDGVNDAPALAHADVGVAMGIAGTEVAKGAAMIVITDDNFATIVSAVEQGRLVYGNIQKLLLYLFATSIDEVIILLAALLAGLPLPLAAVQILWINLVAEGTLTLNLVMEGPDGDEMQRRPIRAGEPLITKAMIRRMGVMVPTTVAATLGYFVWGLSTGAPFPVVQTETFTLLAVCQWFNALNCQSPTRSALRLDLLRNRWLLGGLIVANLLQLAVVYLEPMNRLFHTVPISMPHFFLIGAVASSVMWVEEIRKWRARRSSETAAA